MPKLLGYRKFAGKKDATKRYCVATVAFEPTDYQKEHGYVGAVVKDNIFIPDADIDSIKPEHIGHELIFNYSVDAFGKANLQSVTVK